MFQLKKNVLFIYLGEIFTYFSFGTFGYTKFYVIFLVPLQLFLHYFPINIQNMFYQSLIF